MNTINSRLGSRIKIPPLWVSLLAAVHLIFVALMGHVRWEHIVANGLIIALPFCGKQAYDFVRAVLPLWLTGVLFDSQKYFRGVLQGRIHTGDLYARELAWFSVDINGTRVTWPEWWSLHTNQVLDFLAGFAYATYLLEFFAVAACLFVVDRVRFTKLTWMFCLVNVIGICIYMLYPAAPPWYIAQYGLGPADLSALPSAAGAARFDALLGIHYFASFYARSPNVFGAMPSLHVAYPLIVVIVLWSEGWWCRLFTIAFNGLVVFAAVYLNHHYVLDVLAGLAIATLSSAVVIKLGWQRIGRIFGGAQGRN